MYLATPSPEAPIGIYPGTSDSEACLLCMRDVGQDAVARQGLSRAEWRGKDVQDEDVFQPHLSGFMSARKDRLQTE